MTVHQAVNHESNCGGQGYVGCNCACSKRCESNRCTCNVSKTKFSVLAVVMVALCAKTSDLSIPICYFHDLSLTIWLIFNFFDLI